MRLLPEQEVVVRKEESVKVLRVTGRMMKRKGWGECQTVAWRNSACLTSNATGKRNLPDNVSGR